MRVSGPVGNVGEYHGYPVQVTFGDRGLSRGLATVYMFFDEEWVDRLAVLRRGDHIDVIGQIDEIRIDAIQLKHCELEDIQS